ncbi:uncharacterized protein LOC130898013 isoform X1 [Diorhabda carinulata]|uniref:uncharacterized protein LOC130898013 isoform X1 n=1 Tax=Diorhabda carinulata TaxID=1163345 RepID=UPI0025A1CF28|nr:uncharacterized protein LOC130898013 isoform X1 [Diorhabda carinulata]
MAFVCPPKDSAEQQLKVIKNIKDIVENLEKSMTIGVKPICIPACIPIADYPKPAKSTTCCPPSCNVPVNSKREPPDVMVCYKTTKNHPKPSTDQSNARNEKIIKLKSAKSRELRGGIFYRGCDCCKWFGLQDDCLRTGCHGSPECLTNPPTCGPSQFCDGKHLRKKKDEKKQSNKSDHHLGDTRHCFKCYPAVIQDPVPAFML